MKPPLPALPLSDSASFGDLVFKPHPDEHPGHWQALHVLPNGGHVSVTRGGRNYGTEEAPYEMQSPDGDIHAPLTGDEVTALLRAFGQSPPTDQG